MGTKKATMNAKPAPASKAAEKPATITPETGALHAPDALVTGEITTLPGTIQGFQISGEINAASVESVEDLAKVAAALGQGEVIGPDMFREIAPPVKPDEDVLVIEVRDLHGNLLFKYNDRNGCIEFLQRSKPDGRGGKFPAMLYLIPVQEMMALGRHNLFAETPTKRMQVNGVVANASKEDEL